jgi:hypothetical protein
VASQEEFCFMKLVWHSSNKYFKACLFFFEVPEIWYKKYWQYKFASNKWKTFDVEGRGNKKSLFI